MTSSMEQPHKAKLGLAVWATEPLWELAKHVQLAESIGFDSIWVIDSQLICREVFVTLTALAMSTKTIRLATGVTQPSTRHPAVTASALAALQELSGGRIMSGIGTGFSSLQTLGIPAAKMSELEAFVGAIRDLMAGSTATFSNGFEARMTWPKSSVTVPIFGATSGPKMTQLVSRIADGAILLQGVSDALLDRAQSWLAEGAASGRKVAKFETACWVPFGLDNDPEVARDQVRVRVASSVMNTNPDWFDGAEKEAVLELHRSYKFFEHASSNADHARILPDRVVDQYAVAGDATLVRHQMRRLMSRRDLNHIILTPQASASERTDIPMLLRKLEREVLSQL